MIKDLFKGRHTLHVPPTSAFHRKDNRFFITEIKKKEKERVSFGISFYFS